MKIDLTKFTDAELEHEFGDVAKIICVMRLIIPHELEEKSILESVLKKEKEFIEINNVIEKRIRNHALRRLFTQKELPPRMYKQIKD